MRKHSNIKLPTARDERWATPESSGKAHGGLCSQGSFLKEKSLELKFEQSKRPDESRAGGRTFLWAEKQRI